MGFLSFTVPDLTLTKSCEGGGQCVTTSISWTGHLRRKVATTTRGPDRVCFLPADIQVTALYQYVGTPDLLPTGHLTSLHRIVYLMAIGCWTMC